MTDDDMKLYNRLVADEILEKAVEAYEEASTGLITIDMRAALDAVAPLLFAQGMRDAITAIYYRLPELAQQSVHDMNIVCGEILNRAQEIDPK